MRATDRRKVIVRLTAAGLALVETVVDGHMATEREIPAGTIRVDVAQPLGRLAFYLLEPRSDDGLVNWNVLDDALGDDVKVYPIVRATK